MEIGHQQHSKDGSTPISPITLLGRVCHRVSDAKKNGKKRPRPWEGDRRSIDDAQSDSSSSGSDHRGFIFIPDGQHIMSTYLSSLLSFRAEGEAIPLVVPFQCLRVACHSAATGHLVRISQYSLIHYHDGWGKLVFSTRRRERNESVEYSHGNFVVIEAHRDGIRAFSPENGGELKGHMCAKGMTRSPPMTLEALAREEAHRSQGTDRQNKRRCSTALGKSPFDITGVVDAVSPILVNGLQEEPFAIIEMYQPQAESLDSEVKSAIAVIRGENALCVHPAIQPGQSITLIGVISRKWKVPGEFQKNVNDDEGSNGRIGLYQRLNGRVPDRVILITEASSICWNDELEVTRNVTSPHEHMLPSTVESLTSIRGVVKSVHFHQTGLKDGRESSRIAHFVTLNLLTPVDASQDNSLPIADQAICAVKEQEKTKSARIYLLKHAMPPNLTLGAQVGAIIRAVNIHFINPSYAPECDLAKQVNSNHLCYLACLRSTIAIERCAGESHHQNRSHHPWFIAQQIPFLVVPDHRISDICADPFNTKQPLQFFAEQKLRQHLESNVSIFSSSTGSSVEEQAQRPLLNGDSHDSKYLGGNAPDSRLSGSKMDALLAHHHCNFLAFGESKKQGCSCVIRKSNSVDGGKNGRMTKRDPYAEFFDHAHNFAFDEAIECGSSCNEISSYNHHYHFSSGNMPLVVNIEELRNACAQNFMKRVELAVRTKLGPTRKLGEPESNIECSRLPSGWRSSYHYRGLHLCQVLNDYVRSEGAKTNLCKKSGEMEGYSSFSSWCGLPTDSLKNVYTLGTVLDNHSQEQSLMTAIQNSQCSIPLCEVRPDRSYTGNMQAFPIKSNGEDTWVQIDSVCVSCFCLGSAQEQCAPKRSRSEDGNIGSSFQEVPHMFMPSTSNGNKADGIGGHRFIFLIENDGSTPLVFTASVHMTVKSVASNGCIQRSDEKNSEIGSKVSITNCNSVISIQECLEQTTSNVASTSIVGRLVRARFSFRKLKSTPMEFVGPDGQKQTKAQRCYEGWCVTLSHIEPHAKGLLGTASALQTIEVKLSVPFEQSSHGHAHALKQAIVKLSQSKGPYPDKIITPDQVTMGVAWWIASEGSWTLPLLSEGWDETSDQIVAGKAFAPSVHVEIPLASRVFAKLGYQRFRCNLNEIKSFVVLEHGCSTTSIRQGNSTGTGPSAAGSTEGKFLPGMLNRRIRRVPPLMFRAMNRRGNGEPQYQCRNPYSLLTFLNCEGGVPSVTLAELHWDVCATLEKRDHAHMKPSLLRRIHKAKILGISFCRAYAECTQCFRALTRLQPSKNDNSSCIMGNATSKRSNLSCPSGCQQSRAAVKWECSAIIDDGTGQAKLYAERDGALLLLGDNLDVAMIERGVWELDGGVLFQPAMPASSRLMKCINDARAKSRNHVQQLDRKKKGAQDDLPSAFSLLPACVKAEYLLHQHCRQWHQNNHGRKMDLFCRCKPLSEDATSINQTEIQVAKAWVAKTGLDFGTAQTATLPPLKLSMEDACLASEEYNDDNITGWNLLKSL
ncbi:hypothetical protein ACHAWF_018464 [Thalassiosira exigua]